MKIWISETNQALFSNPVRARFFRISSLESARLNRSFIGRSRFDVWSWMPISHGRASRKSFREVWAIRGSGIGESLGRSKVCAWVTFHRPHNQASRPSSFLSRVEWSTCPVQVAAPLCVPVPRRCGTNLGPSA
jgi:hypothetical protein